MVKTCERAEVHFAIGEKCLGIASIESFPENDGQISFCIGTLNLNGIDYRPVFYWAAGIPHLALLREDIYIQSIYGEREITLDDWKMIMMLDRDKHFKPTTTRKTFFQGIEITSTVEITD